MARIGSRRMVLAWLAASGWLAATAERAAADFVFSMAQVGPDVVLTGQGSMLPEVLFGGMVPELATIPTRIHPAAPSITLTQEQSDLVNSYQVFLLDVDSPLTITGPSNFGTGFWGEGSPGSAPDAFGFAFDGSGANRKFTLYVPQVYTEGAVLNNSTTFFNSTFRSLGVTSGSYSWVLQSTVEPLTETIVLNVAAPVPIPVPPSALLLCTGLLGLVALLRRRPDPSLT